MKGRSYRTPSMRNPLLRFHFILFYTFYLTGSLYDMASSPGSIPLLLRPRSYPLLLPYASILHLFPSTLWNQCVCLLILIEFIYWFQSIGWNFLYGLSGYIHPVWSHWSLYDRQIPSSHSHLGIWNCHKLLPYRFCCSFLYSQPWYLDQICLCWSYVRIYHLLWVCSFIWINQILHFRLILGPISWFVAPEMVSQRHKATIFSICFAINNIFISLTDFAAIPLFRVSSSLQRLFNLVFQLIGGFSFITLFVIPSIICMVLIYLYLPETLGRETHQIVASMLRKRNKRSLDLEGKEPNPRYQVFTASSSCVALQ